MLQIYYGNGKGKTTATVGIAVRAAGAGMNVIFMQFLKDGTSSEISILNKLENITVTACKSCDSFLYSMNDEQKKTVRSQHDEMLKTACTELKSGTVDMVILDEAIDAYDMGMLCREAVERMIDEYADSAEIIMTGHSLPEFFIEKAGYITETTAVKHPFNDGISARKGIEY